MSASPVTRLAAAGQVLVVASTGAQASLTALLRSAGYEATCVDDPYAATVELLVRPMVYRAVVISLQGLYREELPVIRTVRARLPHLEIWLAHTDGRHAAMAEAVRLGAGGILSDEGLHRLDEATEDASTTDATLNARAMMLGGPALMDAPTVTSPAAHSASAMEPADPPHAESVTLAPDLPDSLASGEPILSADELRALLADPESASATSAASAASTGAPWPGDVARDPAFAPEGDPA